MNKTAFVICSTKSLQQDYHDLRWIRLLLLKSNYHIAEDWINHSLVFKNSRPHFVQAPGIDYMKIAVDAISNSDLVIVLMTQSSAYSVTLLKYALHQNKPTILIHKYGATLRNLSHEDTDSPFLRTVRSHDYKVKLGDMV